MVIHNSIKQAIIDAFRYNGREQGGVLGIHGHEILCHYLDVTGSTGSASYQPNTSALSSAIAAFANDQGCDDYCFIHSHPKEHPRLSYADLAFARAFLRLNPSRHHAWMGLVVGEELFLYRITDADDEVYAEPVEPF